MAFTQADLDKLDKALVDGRGARQMTFSDQTVVFHSVEEMLKLRAMIKRDVDSLPTHRLAVTSKGT